MNYKIRAYGLPIFNPVSKKPAPAGLHQYVYPQSGELKGKAVSFCFDGIGNIDLQFNPQGEESLVSYQGRMLPYTCIKATDTFYIVVAAMLSDKPPAIHTFLFDRVKAEAVVIVSYMGKDAAKPLLVSSEPFLGRKITGEQQAEPCSRQCLTDDLVGNRAEWMYTPNDSVLHIYQSCSRVRLGKNYPWLAPMATEKDKENYNSALQKKTSYQLYEEPAFYIKLDEDLYAYSVIEKNMNALLPSVPGGELLAVLDCKREKYIGRTFGIGADNKARFDIVGAPGRFRNDRDEVEEIPCPYYIFD